MSTTTPLPHLLQTYNRQRLLFAQSIADLATRDSNIPQLYSSGVLTLLRPLLTDNVPAIQQSASLAVGRMCDKSEDVSRECVDAGMVQGVVWGISHSEEGNRYTKKSFTFILRSIARHSATLAQAVVSAGALPPLLSCLEEFDPGVREGAAWALGYIARHNTDLAKTVVEAGVIPLLVLALREPHLPLKRISASALSDIAKHHTDLAQAVLESGAVEILVGLLDASGNDRKLKKVALNALAGVAKWSVDGAEGVVEGGGFGEGGGGVIGCLTDVDAGVRKAAAGVCCEVAKHSVELSQLLISTTTLPPLIAYLHTFTQPNAGTANITAALPGILCLGYISAWSESCALAVIVAKGVPALVEVLDSVMQNNSKEGESLKAATAWSLSQIGRHSPDHAKAVNDHGVLLKLLQLYSATTSQSPDLQTKLSRSLRTLLSHTLSPHHLSPLLQLATPQPILKYVLLQYSKILPHDVGARRAFVVEGGLGRVQEIAIKYRNKGGEDESDKEAKQDEGDEEFKPSTGIEGSLFGTKMGEYIRTINDCYPEEIVRYYTPGYGVELLEKIDEYHNEKSNGPVQSQLPPLPKAKDSDISEKKVSRPNSTKASRESVRTDELNA
ncbi:Sperm-associated antigen 6 [Gaertneriomyces sp. JEL0708]|nr:Sperm-associated antigen 6 [Gaertneriomyces sp. JEL0708]